MNETMPKSGHLAQAFGGKNLPVQVLESVAGYYLGTRDAKDGSSYSRESLEYWPNRSSAAAALEQGTWTQRESL